MRLRSHLVAFAVVTITPVLLSVGVLAWWAASIQQQAMEHNVRATTRALALALDRELKRTEALLTVLATSPAIDAGDFAALYRQAVALGGPGSWITVIRPDATQVLNTLRPFGAPLPRAAGVDVIRAVVEGRKTVVSNVFVGAIARAPIVSVDVPVIRHGAVVYSIDMSFEPTRFRDMLAEQRLPERWFAEVVDRNGASVARTLDHERSVGTPLPAAWRTRMAEREEGWASGTTRAGDRAYKAWTTSNVSGWRLAVAVPQDVVHGPVRRALWMVAVSGVLFAVVLGATGLVFGRRITRPIRSLVESANALGRGHAIQTDQALGVTEFDTVNRALASAQEVLRDRAAERERLLTEQLAREAAERREEVERKARERAETTERRWRVLSEIARAITASLDLDVVLQRILYGARDLCASDSAAIFLLDPGGAFLVPRYRTGQWPASYDRFRVEPGRGAGGRAMLSRRPFRTTDYVNDRALPDPDRAIARDTGTVALMVVPILIDSRVEGLLYLSNRSPRPFSDDDEAISTVLAEQAAVAIRNSHLYAAERTARAEAETASRSKDEFLAMLGHELRNPLSAIVGAAGVLRATGVQEPVAERARAVVDRQVAHLARLVDDLLDVGRVVAGKIRLDRRRVDLGELVTGLMSGWRSADRFARHDVSLDAASVWADADETRIEQIVENLVGNALKYTPPGGRVSVRLARDGQSAVLEVEDTGAGIPPKLGNRVFELFVQGDRTLDRSQGGLGIGLTLVKALVELHGGSVEARSEGPGQGSLFTVRLPCAPAPAADASTVPAASLAAPTPQRVLIIEDNDDAREMLRVQLALDGHDVREAADGRTGVELAVAAAPDVALIDVGLPGLDGYEVAQRIRARENGKSMRLIALTGYGRAEDRLRALEAGFDAHLTKPVSPERLAAVIAAPPAVKQPPTPPAG